MIEVEEKYLADLADAMDEAVATIIELQKQVYDLKIQLNCAITYIQAGQAIDKAKQ